MPDHATVAGLSQSEDVRRELPQASAVIQPHLKDEHRPVTWLVKDNTQPKKHEFKRYTSLTCSLVYMGKAWYGFMATSTEPI